MRSGESIRSTAVTPCGLRPYGPYIGAAALTSLEGTIVGLALRILDGFDYRQLPRYGDVTRNDPGNITIDRGAVADEQESARKQAGWLKKKGFQ